MQFLKRRPYTQSVIILTVLIVFVLVLSAFAFSGNWSMLRGFTVGSGVKILSAHERPANVLVVSVASCNSDPRLHSIREGDSNVRIKVVSNSWPFREGQDDCADGVVVQLNQPLGERELIDGHNGREVDVRRELRINRAEVRASDRMVLYVETCNRNPQIIVREESASEVRVMLADYSVEGSPGVVCSESTEYSLRAPLGERALIDAFTGLEVEVSDLTTRET